MSEKFVSGFVSILGRPNAGKSTLLNALLGRKIAIVSDKPQTTRTSIQGILNLPNAQIVFVDTPGIHRPDSLINRKLMQEVEAALEGRDLLLYMADCVRGVSPEDEQAVELVARSGTPCLLLLNKIDTLRDKSKLLPLIERYKELGEFQEFIPISALTGEGLDVLREAIVKRLPEGPRYFPEDMITDQPPEFFAAEVIREKVLAHTRQEVPHAVMVLIDDWEDSDRLLRITASIVVERPGQKGIVIGAKGAMLKKIGTEARLELEHWFGKKIFLELFVKVRKNWRDNPAYLREIDWKR